MSRTSLRMGGYQGDMSVHTRAARVLAAELERSSDLHLDLVPDITAGGRNATDLFAMVEADELDICYFASSYLARRVPDLAVFDLPFLVESRPVIHALLDGALGAEIADGIAARTDFAAIGFWDNGFRHFTNRFRDIRTPEDCRGLKIRTMDSALHQATFSALGFEPLYIDVKDYPAAVRAGIVDAQENPLTNTVNFGVQDSHKHLSLTGHFCGVTLVLANRARLDALGEARRAALAAAMRAATLAQRRFAEEVDGACLGTLRSAQVEILGAGAIDLGAFRAATAPVVADAAATVAPRVLRHFGF